MCGLLLLQSNAAVEEKGGSVAITKELLDLLVCPVCKTPVLPTPKEEGLRCATCHIVYPIRDGFPVMIRDEARPEA